MTIDILLYAVCSHRKTNLRIQNRAPRWHQQPPVPLQAGHCPLRHRHLDPPCLHPHPRAARQHLPGRHVLPAVAGHELRLSHQRALQHCRPLLHMVQAHVRRFFDEKFENCTLCFIFSKNVLFSNYYIQRNKNKLLSLKYHKILNKVPIKNGRT